MVNTLPAQIEPLLTVITGLAFTVICATAGEAAWQPAALVPVMVYELFVLGLTVAEPLLYVYDDAPEGANTKLSPAQIAPLLTEITGLGLTVIVIAVRADTVVELPACA